MEFSPTLQDFVLNLIYDPGARSAFELDPHGTLEAAAHPPQEGDAPRCPGRRPALAWWHTTTP